jgi:glycosyltransferase involved in cell wall biosynthesis
VYPGYRTFYCTCKGLLAGINKVQELFKIDVFEIEESVGIHNYIQKKCNFPVVMRLHGPHLVNGTFEEKLSRDDRFRIYSEKRAFLLARFVSSPSRFVHDFVQKQYKVRWEVSRIIPNPIKRVGQINLWTLSTCNLKQILFVGRFDKHKGGDIAIKAFAKVLEKEPEAVLVFAGPDRGVLINEKVVSAAKFASGCLPQGHVDQVKFLGLCDAEQILSLRKESCLTFSASRNENFAYTSLEALSSGSPYICSAVGGSVEIVHHEKNGLLFQSEDFVELADRICELMNDTLKAERLSVAAIQSCEEQFSIEKIVSQTEQFYKEVLGLYAK